MKRIIKLLEYSARRLCTTNGEIKPNIVASINPETSLFIAIRELKKIETAEDKLQADVERLRGELIKEQKAHSRTLIEYGRMRREQKALAEQETGDE